MKFLFLAIILISCTVTPKGELFVGRTKENLILNQGIPTNVSDTTNGEIVTYWKRNRFRKKGDVVTIHRYYINNKEMVYKYSTFKSKFSN